MLKTKTKKSVQSLKNLTVQSSRNDDSLLKNTGFQQVLYFNLQDIELR